MKIFHLLLLILPVFFGGSAYFHDTAASITARYGSCPKGVILEGEASGIETIRTIKYLIDQNAFLLNQDARYTVPVSRKVLYQVAMALARDNRLGVSLTATQKVIAYGALEPKEAAAQKMIAADKLLTGAVIGNPQYLQGVRLPEGVHPETPENRRFPAICVHKFFDYVFSKKQNEYFRIQLKMANMLFPMADKPAVDGGFLPDTLNRGNLEPTDVANLRAVREHSEEFLAIPAVAEAAAIGETAAFLRFLRDRGGLDLVALARHIMRQ